MKPDDSILSLTREQILDYEIARSWWVQLVSWRWAQALAGKYFAYKANRVARRFAIHRARKRLILATAAARANMNTGIIPLMAKRTKDRFAAAVKAQKP